MINKEKICDVSCHIKKFNFFINCGICGKEIKPVILKKPIYITELDQKIDKKRNITWICCNKFWLLEQKYNEINVVGYDI